MKTKQVGKYLTVVSRNGRDRVLFTGTRVTVEEVLLTLAEGQTFEDVLKRWPKLTRRALSKGVELAGNNLLDKFDAHHRAVSALWDAGRAEEVQLLKPLPVGQHLVIDPRTCFGRLTFEGTRVWVSGTLAYLAQGETIAQLQAHWPRVKYEAIAEAIRVAAAALAEWSVIQAEARYVRCPLCRAPSRHSRVECNSS